MDKLKKDLDKASEEGRKTKHGETIESLLMDVKKAELQIMKLLNDIENKYHVRIIDIYANSEEFHYPESSGIIFKKTQTTIVNINIGI